MPESERPTVILVIGPCGAGKTTWIAQQAGQRAGEWFTAQAELLLDAVQVTTRSRRHYSPAARQFGRVLYHAAMSQALATRRNLYLEAGGATRRERACLLDPFRASGYRIEIVACVPDTPATALDRIRSDQRRPGHPYWRVLVERWYQQYELVEADEMTRDS